MKLTYILVSILLSATAWGGEASGGGSGGDVVYCELSSSNEFSGYYSLDFLATFQSRNHNKDVLAVQSWEWSKNRILNNLKLKAPKLAQSFEQFVDHMENFDDYSKTRIWEEASFGLVDIKDERLIRSLPENCYQKQQDQNIQIIQTVVRTKKAQFITYEYDRKIYQDLYDHRPLQFSLLMVHEWLWDVLRDVQGIRKVNRLLHSSALDDLSDIALSRVLENLGIDLNNPEKNGASVEAKYKCWSTCFFDYSGYTGVGDNRRWSDESGKIVLTAVGESKIAAFESLEASCQNYPDENSTHLNGIKRRYNFICSSSDRNRANGRPFCTQDATPVNSCMENQ